MTVGSSIPSQEIQSRPVILAGISAHPPSVIAAFSGGTQHPPRPSPAFGGEVMYVARGARGSARSGATQTGVTVPWAIMTLTRTNRGVSVVPLLPGDDADSLGRWCSTSAHRVPAVRDGAALTIRIRAFALMPTALLSVSAKLARLFRARLSSSAGSR